MAPVAEDLKVLNVMWDCGTEKVLEAKRYKYVVRTQANATTEMVATVLYLLKTRPNFNSIAVVNQDYAWGRDSWEIFINTLKVFKPDVKVVAEMFPKLGASDFSTEISRLQALKPDVVLTTSWGGDLDTFVRQAGQRGLLKQGATFVMPLLESSLERLGDGRARRASSPAPAATTTGLHPETANDPKHKDFVAKFKAKTGAYPIYPTYHMAQALVGLKTGYEAAIKANGGKWPAPDQVAEAMRKIAVQGLWPRDHDARGRPGPGGATAGHHQARAQVPVCRARQDGAGAGRTGDHTGGPAVGELGQVHQPGAAEGADQRSAQDARLQV